MTGRKKDSETETWKHGNFDALMKDLHDDVVRNTKPAGIRVERSVWERAEKARQEALSDGDPAAMSPQSWFSYLIAVGLKARGDIKEP